jgi:hypothetical protein
MPIHDRDLALLAVAEPKYQGMGIHPANLLSRSCRMAYPQPGMAARGMPTAIAVYQIPL